MRMLNYGKQYIDKDDYKAINSPVFKEYLTTGPLVKKLKNKIK